MGSLLLRPTPDTEVCKGVTQGYKTLLPEGRQRRVNWFGGSTVAKPKAQKVANQSQAPKSCQPIRAKHINYANQSETGT